MKRIPTTALFTLAALVTSSAAVAQGRAVRATVPFDFIIGSKTLPAGTYDIWSPSTNLVEIQNRDTRAAMLTTTSYDSRQSRKGSRLVFDRYGDRYFLSEILCASESIHVSLKQSKAEKQSRMQQATLLPPTEVLVAAR
jgi:hypothetical protein